ncbi:MAG: 5-formyltetrahydrofolate cyclo-ligase [Kiritimatiellia bacterium]
MDPVWLQATSERVQERLIALPVFRAAPSVCVYLPMWGEVRTNRIAEYCLSEGKLLCVPAYDRERGCYRPARWDRQTLQDRGPHGAPQPLTPDWVEFDRVNFVAVPGLAFDLRCGRLGHGGGHFDDLLREIQSRAASTGNSPFFAGLAFEFQIFAQIPMSETDVFMDAVVTENKVIFRRQLDWDPTATNKSGRDSDSRSHKYDKT